MDKNEQQFTIVRRDGFTQEHTRVYKSINKEYNCSSRYAVGTSSNPYKLLTSVKFQNGPVKEAGINGCHNEDLLLMVVDRLEDFQNSEFKCDENQEAIDHIMKAVEALKKRTNKRKDRGVEGTNIV